MLMSTSSVAPRAFEPGSEMFEELEEKRVLLVGAGGLGCEILKNLALSGIRNIDVIDLDTIELSNLNRQFLFRTNDIGRFKAQVAAEFVSSRCPGVTITPHNSPLESFSSSFYSQFDIVIAGLDSVKARRWLNATLCSLVRFDSSNAPDWDTIVPLVDGGTEGWKGQARLFFPHITSCYECSLPSLPKQQEFAGCTIANVPRLPEHCITYAMQVLWKKLTSFSDHMNYTMGDPGSDIALDTDCEEHMIWLYNRSIERANMFEITGVTYEKTMQVVKNIVPAIAATNAIIAAACSNEVFKALTWASSSLSNFFMYMGQTGVYANTFVYEKDPECVVCAASSLELKISPSSPLSTLLTDLVSHPRLKFTNPSITHQVFAPVS